MVWAKLILTLKTTQYVSARKIGTMFHHQLSRSTARHLLQFLANQKHNSDFAKPQKASHKNHPCGSNNPKDSLCIVPQLLTEDDSNDNNDDDKVALVSRVALVVVAARRVDDNNAGVSGLATAAIIFKKILVVDSASSFAIGMVGKQQ